MIHAASTSEFEAAFHSAFARDGACRDITAALCRSPFRDCRLAERSSLPTVFGSGDLARAGGLMSDGPSLPDVFREMGGYVGKILAGAKPADLPVEEPAKIMDRINLKAANALGFTIPPSRSPAPTR